jgi:hypothetical protein
MRGINERETRVTKREKGEMVRAENSAMTARLGNPDRIIPHQWQKGCPSPNPGGRPKTAHSRKLAILNLRALDRFGLPHWH